MHIKEMIIGTVFLVVMVTVSLFVSFFIRELLRAIVRKINNNSLPKEGSIYHTVEIIISVMVLLLILLLAKPYVVGFMEGLNK